MRRTSKKPRYLFLFISLFALMMLPINIYAAQSPVDLGVASSYAVLAGETITNTGTTLISGSAGGNIGVHPGSEITNLAGITLSGEAHQADEQAQLAKAALSTAYDDASGRTPVSSIDSELGNKTLKQGVYVSKTKAFEITGTLTLDGEKNVNSVFIFIAQSTLITSSASKINLINGARVCNIFWSVGSSATLGTNSTFMGTILASTSIAAMTGVSMQGRLLAKTGSVTLDSTKITNVVCTSAPTETGGDLPNTASELSYIMLAGLLLVLAGGIGLSLKKRHAEK